MYKEEVFVDLNFKFSTMKFSILSLTLLLSITITAQERVLTFDNEATLQFPNDPIEIDSDKFVSSYSFNKLVFEDLSHLLLGNSTAPTEGIEATFNEDKSKISLSGILWSDGYGFGTVKGDFSASDNGVYFIDENNGSTSAKITFNYYHPFGGSRSYDDPITSTKAQRAFYTIEKVKQEFIGETLKDFYYTRYLLDAAGIPNNYENRNFQKMCDALEELGYKIDLADIDTDFLSTSAAYIKEKKLEGNSIDNVIKIKIQKVKKKDGALTVLDEKFIPNAGAKFAIKPDVDIDKVIDLYEQTVAKMDSISSKLVKKENKIAQPYWNSKKLWYWGNFAFLRAGRD